MESSETVLYSVWLILLFVLIKVVFGQPPSLPLLPLVTYSHSHVLFILHSLPKSNPALCSNLVAFEMLVLKYSPLSINLKKLQMI